MLDGLWWTLGLLLPLVILQRSLHRQIQGIFLLSTRRPDLTMVLFSLIFFPGVLLHEGSHYIMALLLRVRTGAFSLLPRRMEDGRLRLGYVETASADPIREALIGAAPLIAGGLFVAFAGARQMGLPMVWEAAINSAGTGLETVFAALAALPQRPDFWLWFYLTFAVSSTMLPSSSDRRGWLPLALTAALLLGVSLLAGAGPWLAANAAPLLNRLLRAGAMVLAISVAVHLALLPPLYLIRRVISRLTGMDLV
jgi:hypothetical protein